MEENGVDALETDKKGRPTPYISYTKFINEIDVNGTSSLRAK
ncbi:hypothetical protein [Peribacillus frigoritolerans]|nr:hypothetical protein [Peribacillus frigoritolerans]